MTGIVAWLVLVGIVGVVSYPLRACNWLDLREAFAEFSTMERKQ
jgi:hypothetical protein